MNEDWILKHKDSEAINDSLSETLIHPAPVLINVPAGGYTLKQLSHESGLSERTLRFYMYSGVLPSPGRTGSATRYPVEMLHRILALCALKDRHMSLADIQDKLEQLSPEAMRQEAVNYLQHRVIREQLCASLPLPDRPDAVPDTPPDVPQIWQRYTRSSWFELNVQSSHAVEQGRRVRLALHQLGLPDILPAGQGMVLMTADATIHEYLLSVRDAMSRAGGESFFGGISLLPADVRFQSVLEARQIMDAKEEKHLMQTIEASYPLWAVRGVIHRRPLYDNWFSRWHEDAACFNMTLADWNLEEESALVHAYLANALLLYGLYIRNRNYHNEAFLHEDTRGCFYDFCGYKPDIIYKLETADLCRPCVQQLQDMGMDTHVIQRLLGVVRKMSQKNI